MDLKLSKELNDILNYSKEEAIRTGCSEITPDHIVLGILRHTNNAATSILTTFGITTSYLKQQIDSHITKGDNAPISDTDIITFSKEVQIILRSLFIEASLLSQEPNSLHLLLALLKNNNSVFYKTMKESDGITYEVIRKRLEERTNENSVTQNPKRSQGVATNIESYGFDLTKAAREGRLDPVVGREKEIERLAQILGRRKKNNPILIGEPGVGKSAIADGLAIKIAQRKVSKTLLNKRLVSIDIGSLVAGTKFRGQFEERIKLILKELKENPDTILFIDELHTLVGAGGVTGSLDAANMLKPALARGEIQCIGATTLDEFREIIEKDGALERRFQKIMIEPTTFEETLHILNSIKFKYEKYHNVIYSEEAIHKCVSLSIRYISDRNLPDKAIDVMDEAGAKAHIGSDKVSKKVLLLESEMENIKTSKEGAIKEKQFEKATHLRFLEKETESRLNIELKKIDSNTSTTPKIITAEDIEQVMSVMTGIPLNRIAMNEGNKLLSMGKTLREKIVGQDDAVDMIVKAIQRNRAGLKDPNKPIGSFLFLGPTGVGKTYLAKILSEYLFDSQDSIIRIDMSEYMEKYSVSRLIGAPPGYIGYDEGGQLSERVRRKPYSVVLLDEIEKGHPDIFNLLLQVLDEGRLTDSSGRNIDFRNTVLIMTSNIGSRELKDFGKGIGYTSNEENRLGINNTIIDKAVNKTFTPEFINRLDEQIYFKALDRSDIEKIIDIELEDLKVRINNIGYKFSINKSAKSFIAGVGYDPRYGARPLKRAIRKYIEDPIAEAIISGQVGENNIKVVLNKDKTALEISR